MNRSSLSADTVGPRINPVVNGPPGLLPNGKFDAAQAFRKLHADAPSIEDRVRKLFEERKLLGSSLPIAELKEKAEAIFDELNVPHTLRLGILKNVQLDIDKELAEKEKQRAEAVQNLGVIKRQIAALDDIEEWGKQPLRLERPDGSALHKLKEALKAGSCIMPAVDDTSQWLHCRWSDTSKCSHD